MEHFAGLDVATVESALCVVDGAGKIVFEAKLASEPAAIAAALKPYAQSLRQIGHEAGALSPWLQHELKAMGWSIQCLETVHVKAALKAQRNKTDRNDARGLAQMMRTGWFKSVHVKSEASYRLRLLLSNRRNLKRKFLDLENAVRHSLKAFGVKVSAQCGRMGFDAKVRELVGHDPMLSGLCDAMLRARAVLWAEYTKLHRLVVQVTLQDEVCQRFMAIPGVGPVTALAFKSAVDDPTRFKKSTNVGAYFGLTPKREQSGTSIDREGAISRAGDGDVRTLLYEAASCLLTRSRESCSVKRWGQRIAKRAGHRKAVVAVARRLSVVMLAMWRDGTFFEPGEAEPAPRRPRKAAAPRALPKPQKHLPAPRKTARP
ncbi:MAG: IS110 family transposase [Hyphomonadaceae bacterium]|jgi:transposase|nr:IS110 family transposase [Hyphomonadaceae bacterium]